MSELPTETMYDELELVVEHLNADHADTVSLVTGYLAGHSGVSGDGAVVGELRTIDGSGLHGRVRVGDGEPWIDVTQPFDGPPTSIDDVRAELFALLVAAREAAPDDQPLTSLEAELSGESSIPTWLCHVAAVTDLTPSLREITFGGLNEFESLGGDEFLHLLAPPPGRDELTIDADFSWSAHDEMPEEDRPVGAYYSVRRLRPDAGELDMWFVLHDHAGPASSWAASAAPGMPVGLWGPRRSFGPHPQAAAYLFVVDETGLGAACSLIEQVAKATPSVPMHLIAEVLDPDHEIEPPPSPSLAVTWCHRREETTEANLLLNATRRSVDAASASGLYAFGAAESRVITAVRRYLRDTMALPADQVSMTGYWRRSSSD